MRIAIIIFILSFFIGLTAYTTVYAHNEPPQICDNGVHTYNPHCVTPTPTINLLKPSCTPTPEDVSPTLVIPIPTDEVVSDTPSPTAGNSATPTVDETKNGNDSGDANSCLHRDCSGNHVGGTSSSTSSPASPPSTGRAEH